MKKVSFGAKPSSVAKPGTADDWVLDRERPAEPVKRLTIDLPQSLHRRVKTACAMENLVMADVVREMLEKRFPDKPAAPPTVNTEAQKHDSTEGKEGQPSTPMIPRD